MKLFAFIGICSLFITFVAKASAQSEVVEKSGFFGDIRVGGGVVSSHPSGLEVFDDNERLNGLDVSGNRQSVGLLLIGGEAGYNFNDSGTKIFAGVDIDKPFYLSISQELEGVGSLTLSALYETKEVWKNPYLVGVDRAKTDADSVGFSMNWDNVLATRMRLFFDQKFIDVKQDNIGLSQPDLRRDGTDTTMGLGFSMDWGAGGVFNPSIRHIWIEREGASNTGCGYAAGVKHVLVLRNFSFATSLDISRTDYDKLHPVFNKKREETTYGISETVSIAEPFGFENLYLFGVAAYGKTDANITFFYRSSVALGTGIGYKF